MAIKVWVHCVDENEKTSAHEVVEHLIQEGIEVQGFDAYLSSGPGAIINSEVTPEICEQLRDLSRNGKIPVLACCFKTIPGDAAWRLMEAGASDVLGCTECKKLVHAITSV